MVMVYNCVAVFISICAIIVSFISTIKAILD